MGVGMCYIKLTKHVSTKGVIQILTYKTDVKELKKLMVEKNVDTITELSARTGVGRDTLSKVLSGKINPSFEVMAKIASSLDMSSEKAGEIFFAKDLRNT